MNNPRNDVVRQVGRNLRRLKELRRMSVQQLADASSVDRNEIDRLLRGEGELFADTLFLLAGALEVGPEELGAGITWVVDDERGGGYRLDRPEPD